MKISIISDVHITTDKDESFHLFLRFLEQQKELRPDFIVLLGDIFDVIAGDQKKYLKKYDQIFQKIAELIRLGMEFCYFEGNHDMHLSKLMDRASRFYGFDPDCMDVIRKYRIIKDEGRVIYLAHGDELEGDDTYLRYKKFIHGRIMGWVADHLMPFSLLENIASKASKKSRGINYVKYSSPEERINIQNSFREIAAQMAQKYGASHVFLGHSHLKEIFQGEQYIYGNCGYFSSEKQFLCYDQGVVSFISLK